VKLKIKINLTKESKNNQKKKYQIEKITSQIEIK
jgi:hypothetical protein